MAVSKPDSQKGKYRTILSIDGGGIRGIIPGVILRFLELVLQVITTLTFWFFCFFLQKAKVQVDFKILSNNFRISYHIETMERNLIY